MNQNLTKDIEMIRLKIMKMTRQMNLKKDLKRKLVYKKRIEVLLDRGLELKRRLEED